MQNKKKEKWQGVKNMKDTPFFSVIMPTYNRTFCICNAIDSLIAQTYKEFEFIIIDDCSTDGTEELIKKTYEKEFKSERFTYIKHKKNSGLNASRNTGLNFAKNDWIVFLDDDNTLLPNYLETYSDAINQNPNCKVFYSQIKDPNGNAVGMKMDYSILINANFIDMGAFVAHKSIFDIYGRFDIHLKRHTDYDFILRCARLEKTCFIPKVVFNYNFAEFPRISNSESSEEASKIIYEKMSKIYYPFYENVKQISSINVFYDSGSGFSEYEKDVFYHFPINFHVTDSIKSIMIRPCTRFCIVKDISIKIDGKDFSFTTNAYRQNGGTFYFDTDNPIISFIPNIQGELNVFMNVFYVDKETSNSIKTDYEKLLLSDSTLKNIQNSKFWKITKPLRWILRYDFK